MHKGSYKGLEKGSNRGTGKGLSNGLLKGLRRNQKSTNALMDVFLVIGNSIAAGTGGTPHAQQPTAGKAFEFDRTRELVLPFGQGAAVNNFQNNRSSFWPQYCYWYNNHTGRIPVIINRGAASSTCSTANDNNDWQVTGSNYNSAVAAAKKCLRQLGKKKLKAILVGEILINDVQSLAGTGSFTSAQVKGFLQTLVTNLTNEFGADVPILFNTPARTASIVISQRLSEIRKGLRDVCQTNANCYIAATMSTYTIGSYYVDNIHPNENGYIEGGRMFAWWWTNFKYPKWPRSIMTVHYGVLEADKERINNWFKTWESTYFQMEFFYPSIKGGISTNGGSLMNAFDWTFLCAPSVFGNFTQVVGSYLATNGTNQYIDVGFNPSLCARIAAPGDLIIGAKLLLNNTAAGTAAFVFGVTLSTNIIGILQTITSTITYAVSQDSSDEYSGETKLNAPAWWTTGISGSTCSLYKNGSSVDSFSVAAVAFPNLNLVYMCRTVDTAGSRLNFMNGRIQCMYAAAKSAISNVAAFEADIDTLQT